MADESETDSETVEETRVESDATTETDEGVILDLDSAQAYEERIEELETQLQEQREQVDELQDLLLDLSTRVADGNDVGVCPECHGPMIKQRRLFRSNRIKCQRCGEVFHEY